MDQMRAELEPYLAATGVGNTDFLGDSTRRTGALIAGSPTTRSRFIHPAIIDTLDLVLGDQLEENLKLKLNVGFYGELCHDGNSIQSQLVQ